VDRNVAIPAAVVTLRILSNALKLGLLQAFCQSVLSIDTLSFYTSKLAFFDRQPIDLDHIQEIGSLHLDQRRGERFHLAKQVRRAAGLCESFL
jgi:hypothetical protein